MECAYTINLGLKIRIWLSVCTRSVFVFGWCEGTGMRTGSVRGEVREQV